MMTISGKTAHFLLLICAASEIFKSEISNMINSKTCTYKIGSLKITGCLLIVTPPSKAILVG